MDFFIEIPPKWVRKSVSCTEAVFESRDEGAEVIINLRSTPNYSSNPTTALAEFKEDLGKNQKYEQQYGGSVTVMVKKVEDVALYGWNALRFTNEEVPEYSFMYCTTASTMLIVPRLDWSSDSKTKWIYEVDARRCKTDGQHTLDMWKMLESFRPWLNVSR